MQIKELIKQAHENAKAHGFWDYHEKILQKVIENDDDFSGFETKAVSDAFISQKLLLITGEVTEAMEGLRKDDIENFREELADVAIRLFDLAGGLGIDLETEIKKKMEKNKDRPYKHGKAF